MKIQRSSSILEVNGQAEIQLQDIFFLRSCLRREALDKVILDLSNCISLPYMSDLSSINANPSSPSKLALVVHPEVRIPKGWRLFQQSIVGRRNQFKFFFSKSAAREWLFDEPSPLIA